MIDFRRDIQGLRALAILLVVGYHAAIPGFSGGYIGVDVFFVLSGYLITSLLVAERERTGSIHMARFYARRARRLLPAVAVMLVATMVAAAIVYAPLEQDRMANTSLATAAYGSNVYFARASTDYLAAATDTNPLLHTWSLSVEEQFYLVWPLFVLLAASTTSPMARRRRLAIWMGVALVSSLMLSLYLTRRAQPWAFFLSPPRAWEFAVGGLAALAIVESPVLAKIADGIGWLALGGILYASLLFTRATPFPGVAALVPTLSTAIVLLCTTAVPRGRLARVLSIGPLQELGRLSYSWYLWHWPFLVIAAAVLGPLSPAWRLGMVAASLVVAKASYHWIEEPVRHHARLSSEPRWSLSLAALVATVGVALAIGWKTEAAVWAHAPSQAPYSTMWNDFPAIYRMDCDDYFRSADVKECAFGNPSAAKTVVLLGDSHAGHWFPALSRLVASDDTVRLIVLTKSACPAVDAPFVLDTIGRVYSECQIWLGGVLRRIQELHPDLVLVSYASKYPFTPAAWQTGIPRVFAELSESARAVIQLRDVPDLGFDPPACVARMHWLPAVVPRRPTCQTPLADAEEAVIYSLQREQSVRYANVTTLDLNDAICPNQMCDVVQDGILTYRDSGHLTTKFSESLAGVLGARMNDAVGRLTHRLLFTITPAA